MRRSVRVVTSLSAVAVLSLAAGAGIAGAQEMDHGRTRPSLRTEVQTNQVKTQTAVAQVYAGYVRG